MRPLRYSINVTLDGCFDHREMVADDDLHRHAVENLGVHRGVERARQQPGAAWWQRHRVGLLLPGAGRQVPGTTKQAVPSISRMAALWHPVGQGAVTETDETMLKGAEVAARALGLQLQLVEARSPADFERAFTDMTKARVGALSMLPSNMFFNERRRIVDLVARSRLPAVYPWRQSSMPVASCRMDSTWTICSAEPRSTWTGSSRARRPVSSPWSNQPSSIWSSTSRPPRRSASRSRPRCWRGRIRSSNSAAFRARRAP
jgi:hypothetical protein